MTDAPSGLDMNMAKMASKFNDPDSIAQLLTETGPTGDSPAEIIADIINVHRMDIRRLGLSMGVDVEANLMTPERAGDLLAGTVSGDGIELVKVFNEMAERRDELLSEALDDDEHTAFLKAKHTAMNTGDPGGFEDN